MYIIKIKNAGWLIHAWSVSDKIFSQYQTQPQPAKLPATGRFGGWQVILPSLNIGEFINWKDHALWS